MRTRWAEKEVIAPITLIVSAFAPVTDASRTLTPQLQRLPGSRLVLVACSADQRLGGSVLAQVVSQVGSECPDVEAARLVSLLAVIDAAKRRNDLLAYHDRSDGGLLAAVLEMSFAGRAGVDLHVNGDLLAGLFNEEIGVIVQLDAARYEGFVEASVSAGLFARCVGTVRDDESVVIHHDDHEVFRSTRAALEQTWAETSYRIQRQRDDERCADEEFASITRPSKGLTSRLTFDPARAPVILTGTPTIAILREQGVNGHMEMAAAFERAGFAPVDVHMTDLLSGRVTLDSFPALAACGGFSYGDVLGGGGGWAKSLLFHETLRDQFAEFVGRDRLLLGVCNGCQMMAQLKSLIPDADHWPRFVTNRSERFEARTVQLRINNVRSPWLDGMQGSVLPVAVAHGEGRAEFVASTDFDALKNKGQLAMQYVDPDSNVTLQYPFNPNGAVEGLAGLTAADGRVLILMPHPERVFRSVTNAWRDGSWGENGPWLKLFQNARAALDQ